MFELKKGQRVCLNDKKVFGFIARKGVLGLKSSSFVITDDMGKQHVYTGPSAKNHVVYIDTCVNEDGDPCPIPIDHLCKR